MFFVQKQQLRVSGSELLQEPIVSTNQTMTAESYPTVNTISHPITRVDSGSTDPV